MTDPTTEPRWGISGPNWQDIRHIPAGEAAARGWATNLAAGSRTIPAETINLYCDTGNGWEFADTYPAGGTR